MPASAMVKSLPVLTVLVAVAVLPLLLLPRVPAWAKA